MKPKGLQRKRAEDILKKIVNDSTYMGIFNHQSYIIHAGHKYFVVNTPGLITKVIFVSVRIYYDGWGPIPKITTSALNKFAASCLDCLENDFPKLTYNTKKEKQYETKGNNL